VILKVYEANLPIMAEWDWAWKTTPIAVHERYEQVRDQWVKCHGIYEETLRACRVCLEKVVDSIPGAAVSSRRTSLYARIENLRKNGLLDGRLCTIAQAIRELSNPSAHGGDPLLDKEVSRDGRVHFFRLDGTIAFFHLEALIAHVFFHPQLRKSHKSEPEWTALFEWLDLVKIGHVR
jgi:hypothetical protein